jgi:WD40-like Beta Propeller Repeat
MKFGIMLALPALALSLIAHAGGGDELKLTNLEKINTEADEDDPFVTPSGQSIYYASNKAGTWDILLSKRSSAGQPFPAGKPLVASKEDDERSPFLFQAGQNLHLYFATNHVPDEKLKELKNFDIVRKTGDRAPLPLLGISEKEDEMHPWLTASGKEFYFSRKLNKEWVMFVTQGDVPGPGLAKEVGFPPGFCRATLSSAGLTMYLQGPMGDGRTGIFWSKRVKIGAAWSKPEPVSALDHPDAKRGNLSPCLSGDRLYFSSDRPGGKGGLDIWSVVASQLK